MAELDRILERYDLSTIDAALARRRAREKRRLATLSAQRRKLEAQLRKLAQMTGDGTARAARGGRRGKRRKGAKAPRRTKAGKIVRRPNARRLNEISLAQALEQVMSARKKPIHYKELMDTVVKKKLYRTKSKNLLSTVAVTLKRDGRFKKVEPGMYALR
jgi:hypothetical protein